jgi:microcystin-dependent protein
VSSPFLGQILTVPFNFAPRGWAVCNGQLIPISQMTALFSLLGTQYGGNGQSNFALPNLQGRVPVHFGQGSTGTQYEIGQTAGEETHTLTQQEIPAHTHAVAPLASDDERTTDKPGGSYPAEGGVYASTPNSNAPMASGFTSAVGGTPHTNLQPYVVLNYIIAQTGTFPARS